LVNIAMALNKTSNLDELFKETPASYINETPSNKRKRGIR
jgi:hypothetical protein